MSLAAVRSRSVDGWVLSNTEVQLCVPWPCGQEIEVQARYQGENRWTVEHHPREIGPWEYSWTQTFVETPFESAVGHFDVVAGDMESVRMEIVRLADDIEGGGVDLPEQRQIPMEQFYRLGTTGNATHDARRFSIAAGS